MMRKDEKSCLEIPSLFIIPKQKYYLCAMISLNCLNDFHITKTESYNIIFGVKIHNITKFFIQTEK